jgi:hypothetical protein
MRLCRETNELAIFDAPSLRQIIKFKWDTYGLLIHVVGCLMHTFSCLMLILYIDKAYYHDSDHHPIYLSLLTASILYPTFYEVI